MEINKSTHDLIIRNGKILDGSGKKPFFGDIAIDGGKITSVGRVESSGKEEFDAKGNLVTPGWVDIHTHYDGQVSWDPYLTPSSWHGVTTAVMGNCGVGFAPVRPGDENFLIQLMEGVEDIPGSALHEGIDWDWETFPEFLDAIDKKEFVMDVGFMMGHGPLRSYVMGYERCQNQVDASEEEISKMSGLVTEAIEAGALGFSTSRTVLNRDIYGKYVPGTEASSEEMRALAFGVDKAGEGTLEINLTEFDTTINLMLEDVVTGDIIPINSTTDYYFINISSGFTHRFNLLFINVTNILQYEHINRESNSTESIDILGRKVTTEKGINFKSKQ